MISREKLVQVSVGSNTSCPKVTETYLNQPQIGSSVTIGTRTGQARSLRNDRTCTLPGRYLGLAVLGLLELGISPTALEPLHDQLAMVLAMVTKPPWTEPQVTSPLSQHPLYPLWSRLWTSPQNVGNRLHLSIVTTSSLPSLEQAVDFSTECWQ
ncbi:hypothetical protein F2Q68_00045350 [Brassica cretica]|uniref:Uncharacterized protein n=1 Tax=Brassica cretica TaxID=69181 RepID=A0A8S9LLX8_BRACR|nr:hypothetical protein F2Q68_00045350 [Brassica cretica]